MPAGRDKPLITHLEDELREKVKMLADHAGMSASSYVRQILRDHVDNPGVKSLLKKQW